MGEVFEVSAAERMENPGPLRDWDGLLASLHHLVEDSGRNLVRAACDRGLQRLSEQLLSVISDRRSSSNRILARRDKLKSVRRSLFETQSGKLTNHSN